MGTLTPLFVPVADLPLVPDEGTVAYIIDIATGELADEAYNWESAINYIQGLDHIAVACADEVHACNPYPGEACYYCETYGSLIRTQAQLQAMFDHEREIQEDCFGLRHVQVA